MKKQTKEIVINKCYGGFGLSNEAYEQLIKWGIPVRKYINEKRNPKTGLYDIKESENEGEVIFDKELTPKGEDSYNDIYWKFKGMSSISRRYWETWLEKNREYPLLLKVIKKLGKKASSRVAALVIVEIPVDIEYEIKEHDGFEHIAEKHKTWG